MRKLVAAALFVGVASTWAPNPGFRPAAACSRPTESGHGVLGGLGLVLCAQQTTPPPAADKWQFAEDDEQTPGWREVVGKLPLVGRRRRGRLLRAEDKTEAAEHTET